jgi:acetyl-CoA carboxylase carboxyltransferase component
VDVAVADEGEAVAVAKRLVSYFQGPLDEWEEPDQALLRDVVPERRRRAYDVRAAITGLADADSATFLREASPPRWSRRSPASRVARSA